MSRLLPGVALHQQDGMKLGEFAALHGLTVRQASNLARGGKILGAQRHSVSGHWFVYPPAKLMAGIRSCKPKVEPAPCLDAPHPVPQGRGAEAFDFGTSPHGLPADSLGQYPESLEEEDGAPDESAAFVPAGFIPEAFRSLEVRSAGRCIKAALLKQDSHTHRLALDDCEFVHLFRAVEHYRNRTRKIIGKGLDKVGSLRVTDSLWQKLQAEIQRCHQRRPA